MESQADVRGVLASSQRRDAACETRLGIDRQMLFEMLMRWPEIDDRGDDSPSAVAIDNSPNEFANGLRLSVEDWQEFGVTPAQVASPVTEAELARRRRSTGLR